MSYLDNKEIKSTLEMIEKNSYNQGLKDMMECQHKISHMSKKEICKCFDLNDEDEDEKMWKLNPNKLLKKIKKWEDNKEFHIGDKIINKDFDNFGQGVITRVVNNEFSNVLWKNGDTGYYRNSDLIKIGKQIYIDEILRELQKD